MSLKSLDRLAHRPAYEHVADELQSFIRKQRLWGDYLPAERELCRQMGVSRITVRKGLKLLERRGLIARQQGRGTMVLSRQAKRRQAGTRQMAVALGETATGRAAASTVAGFTHAAGELDWGLSFHNLMMPSGRARFFEGIAGDRVEGAALLAFIDRGMAAEILRVANCPVVLADHYFPELPMHSVNHDAEGGARSAVEHLLSLGHRRIGYIEISERELNPWRHAGYVKALRASGIEPDPALVIPAPFSYEGGRAAGGRLLDMDDAPTAILVFDELRAYGAWRAAEERGLEVGRDLALVAFGEEEEASDGTGGLTLVQSSFHKLGRTAAAKLGEMLEGDSPGEVLTTIPSRLVVRASSAGAER
jgi:DNA-binding LacI/PurR family transcriptional regulator